MGNLDRRDNSQETSAERAEKYYQESLAMAQGMSRRWPDLRKEIKNDPNFLTNSKLIEINDMTKLPTSGIQVWFENRIQFINQQCGNDDNSRSRMMYRLKEELENVKRLLDHYVE